MPFAIERGKILAYRVFDAGEKIALEVAEQRIPGSKRLELETKLNLVSRAYELLKGETEVSRTQLLELTVVVLILVEILAAFQRH